MNWLKSTKSFVLIISYEIVSGCNEGDIVITSVPTGTTLADGDKVKVVTSK